MEGEGREGMGRMKPSFIGAVFTQGVLLSSVLTYKYDNMGNVVGVDSLVDKLDVGNKLDREKFVFKNSRIFNDGTTSQPEMQWKAVVDYWLMEVKEAVNRSNGVCSREQGLSLEKDIKAVMAVSASARAMEVSGGEMSKYLAVLAHAQKPENGRQDEWAEYLMHGDKGEKLMRVINMPLVKHFYLQILKDAGYEIPLDWHEESKVIKYEEIRGLNIVDIKKMKKEAEDGRNRLFEYLKSEGGYKGGYNEYISSRLMSDEGELLYLYNKYDTDSPSLWAAARLACDAFLTDKQTVWEYSFTKDYEKNPFGMLKPSPGWGGDPLREVIQPSFLPRLKGSYPGKAAILHDWADSAFRPRDIFGQDLRLAEKILRVSMTENYKALNRYTTALWAFYGDPIAVGIAQWNKDSLGNLSEIAKRLHELYGGIRVEDTGHDGKEIVAEMFSRIILTKAYAVLYERSKPGFMETIGMFFDIQEKQNPFQETASYLFGLKGDGKSGGLIASLAGGRMQYMFENKYGSAKNIQTAYAILKQAGLGTTTTAALTKTGISLVAELLSATTGKRK